MKIAKSRVGSRSIITPETSLTGKDLDSLDQINKEITGKGRSEIILDMKSVSFVDSEVLEYILKIHEDLKIKGGYLKLINVNTICRDIFTATRLVNALYIFDDIHEAIRN